MLPIQGVVILKLALAPWGIAILVGTAVAAGPESTADRDQRVQAARDLDMRAETAAKASKFAAAAALAVQALEIRTELYPNGDHLELAANLRAVAAFHQSAQDYGKARPYAERALSAYEKVFPVGQYPDGHAELAEALSHLGYVLELSRDFRAARPYREKALAMRERLYPADKFPNGQPDVAWGLSNLGMLLRSAGEPAKAVPYLERALAMWEKLCPEDGPPENRSHVARSARNLGLLFQSMGELAKARPHLEHALAVSEKLYPKERFPDGHPELAGAMNNLGLLLHSEGKYADARTYLEQAVELHVRLFPKDKFPNGHPDPGCSQQNLGSVLYALGELSAAQVCLEQSLDIRERLYPPDRFPRGHPDLAVILGHLSILHHTAGESGPARRYAERALAAYERAYPVEQFPNGHPYLATGVTNLATILGAVEEGEAITYFERAVRMNERLYPVAKYPDGHPEIASSLQRLAARLREFGVSDRALPIQERALAMRERLYPESRFPDGHPDLMSSLGHQGLLLRRMGEYAKARPYYERASAMAERLYPTIRYPTGHPELVMALSNLGALLHSVGDFEAAQTCLEQAVTAGERLTGPTTVGNDVRPAVAGSLNNLGLLLTARGDAKAGTERLMQAVDLIDRAYSRDRYPAGHPARVTYSHNLGLAYEAAGDKAGSLKVLGQAEQEARRLFVARAEGASDSEAFALQKGLPRCRDAYLSVAARHPETAAASYAALWASKGTILPLLERRHEAAVRGADPESREAFRRLTEVRRQTAHLISNPLRNRAEQDRRLAALADEQASLERRLARSGDGPRRSVAPNDLMAALAPDAVFVDIVRYSQVSGGRFSGRGYLAYVIARGPDIRRIDLGVATDIDAAVASWRRSIAAEESTKAPDVLKTRVWDPIAAELPAGISTIYVCPDGDLSRIPWPALPGSRPGTVLLEEYALVVAPAGPWLASQLVRTPASAATKDNLLVIGNVDYGAAPDGVNVAYPPLRASAAEARQCLAAFAAGADAMLEGRTATTTDVGQRLGTARYAHIASHGFFDERALSAERVRSERQLRDWVFSPEGTERAGVGARNPFAYVGLALAGANDPRAGGVLTGLDVVGLRLEQLQLCVLSACETGLGDQTEGFGTTGLQQAFHVAGCPNVMGSLWKVDDAATAALMAQFYHELRANKRPPAEALRHAQLTIYRHPDRIAALTGNRSRPEVETAAKLGATDTRSPEKTRQTTPTRLWAAFTLSGTGR
jgi:CHAT domain-containing protein/tetratricopeptide (TPR) repeat protein